MSLRIFTEAPYIIAFEDDTGGGLVHDTGDEPQVMTLETLEEATKVMEELNTDFPDTRFMLGKIIPLEN